MLGDKDAAVNVAVRNLETARKYYQDTLGLKEVGSEGEDLVAFKSGNTSIYVYKSEFAGTNKATALTWVVGSEMEDIVQALKAKGVRFEHYDMPDMKREGDTHIFGNRKVVWFKDPDGNILNIVNE